MNLRKTIKRIGKFVVHRVTRLVIHNNASTTAMEGISDHVAHKDNGPPDAAPIMELQGRFENLSSSNSGVKLIQPENLRKNSTGRLFDLLAADYKKNLIDFSLKTHTSFGTELDIWVFAAQPDWRSGRTNAANTPGNTNPPPRNDDGAGNDPVKSSSSTLNVKQNSPGRRTVTDAVNPIITAANEQTRAHSATSNPHMPYVGGGKVIMRVSPSPVSSSSRLGSSSSFKAGNSASSLNSSNEGGGTDGQGGKQRPQCHLCDSFFTRKNSLGRHLANVHGDQGYISARAGSGLRGKVDKARQKVAVMKHVC
ncbi:hypothetical protein AGABI1DRAFT_127131 [Agaricus bisporus var. burnettii JB137-S8]|uniref:C2H2-type domain-containing protein n=1 Tax=Agaricus bisporus var. burnettii (strain JB137-S8 / ATCC MYA-4627 / FGSC 10392) TaxID=597362 RepID=K5XD90_AGABU|nr:uncharacterized protein AGABI1DRAFT_127131 [Agaricus bisporus var. burnettii JB137-S8]EKM81102.1 hypothetical protein AGABI1DRAFT_127131 [Agaricus bisporus var. burnettii JB137-S8]